MQADLHEDLEHVERVVHAACVEVAAGGGQVRRPDVEGGVDGVHEVQQLVAVPALQARRQQALHEHLSAALLQASAGSVVKNNIGSDCESQSGKSNEKFRFFSLMSNEKAIKK